MEKEYYLKLTLAVYRVTDLFPEKEALRPLIRETADKVLVDLLNNQNKNGSRSVENLISYFDLAEAQNWLDPRNFLVLRREYNKIGKLIGHKPICHNTGKTVEKLSKSNFSKRLAEDRREKILKILRENGKVKTGDLTKSFPELNRRTLLRDLESFSRNGFIVRNGNGRGVYYIRKNVT